MHQQLAPLPRPKKLDNIAVTKVTPPTAVALEMTLLESVISELETLTMTKPELATMEVIMHNEIIGDFLGASLIHDSRRVLANVHIPC